MDLAGEGGVYESEPIRRNDVVRYDESMDNDLTSSQAKWATQAKQRFIEEAFKTQQIKERTKVLKITNREPVDSLFPMLSFGITFGLLNLTKFLLVFLESNPTDNVHSKFSLLTLFIFIKAGVSIRNFGPALQRLLRPSIYGLY
ncbi:unnamed protein product [Protopolystoma xenopodis]|uniref:Uncharacterized protein n=1 Tax=Protopolystoma xenopodis TaxID=117903 RepID=A0A3S5B8K6_9PLAT|nr:unnamed protein product [Protopolystoma xenopodis]